MIDILHNISKGVGAVVSGLALLFAGATNIPAQPPSQPASVAVAPLPTLGHGDVAAAVPTATLSTASIGKSISASASATQANIAVVVPGTAAGVSQNYVTQDQLAAQLQQATNALRSLIYQQLSAPNSTLASGGILNSIAISQRIDQLTNVTLSNATVHGVSGLTAADIPTNIVASNYFSLTDILPVANGGTGTSTAPTYGKVLLGNASGGYDLVATSSLGIVGGGSGTVLAGTAGQFPYFAGSGTTVTATSSLFLSTAGNVGIGTTTPDQAFVIQAASSNALRIERAGFPAFGATVSLSGNNFTLSAHSNFLLQSGCSYDSSTCSLNLSTVSFRTMVGGNASLLAGGSGALWVNGATIIGGSNSFLGAGGPSSGLVVEGKTGIGTSTPYAKLTIWGADTSANTKSLVVASAASTTLLAVSNDGNATLFGTLTQGSDRRLKENITALADSYGLAAITQLNPVSFNRIDQPGSRAQLGFIAQDVQPILPELVSTSSATALTPDGTLTLNYIDIIPAMVKAIQELAGKISTTAHLVIRNDARTRHVPKSCAKSFPSLIEARWRPRSRRSALPLAVSP
jgi:hypothetical protein